MCVCICASGIRIEALSRRGPFGGASASASAESTPVHARRAPHKKKRKPADWRSKGAYHTVDDAHSSDDPKPAHAVTATRHAPRATRATRRTPGDSADINTFIHI